MEIRYSGYVFRDYHLVFRVSSFGFRVLGFAFGVEGFAFGVEGLTARRVAFAGMSPLGASEEE